MELISMLTAMLNLGTALRRSITRSPTLTFGSLVPRVVPCWSEDGAGSDGIVLHVRVTNTGNEAITLDSCECILVDQDGELLDASVRDSRKLSPGDAYTFVLMSPKLPFRINRISVWDSTLKRWDTSTNDLMLLHVLLRRMGLSIDPWLAWSNRTATCNLFAEMKLSYLRRKEDWFVARSAAHM